MSEEKGKYEAQGSSPTITKLATALVKAQAEMPAAKFNATNPFFKSKYADLGSVIETARPVLAKHGLAILQPVVSSGNGRIGIRTMVIHESGEFISSDVYIPVLDEKGKSLVQSAGSIISYLRRYSLSSTLGIYADEDTDANEGKKEEKKTRKQPTKNIETEATEALHSRNEGDDGLIERPKSDSDVIFGEVEKVAKPKSKMWPGYYVGALVENELADHPKNAVNILNHFPELPRNLAKEKIVMLGEIYRQRREDNGLSIEQAAETAWAEWSDWNKEN